MSCIILIFCTIRESCLRITNLTWRVLWKMLKCRADLASVTASTRTAMIQRVRARIFGSENMTEPKVLSTRLTSPYICRLDRQYLPKNIFSHSSIDLHDRHWQRNWRICHDHWMQVFLVEHFISSTLEILLAPNYQICTCIVITVSLQFSWIEWQTDR